MEEILVSYWRNGEEILNLGEHFTELLVNEFGYKTRCYSDALSKNEISNYDSCLLVIGSRLHKRYIDSLKVPKILVWGKGKGRMGPEFEFDPLKEPYHSKLKIFAVRGPHTIKQLNLNPDTPIGDPGFLMSLIFPLERDPSKNNILYIPHHSLDKDTAINESKKIGTDKLINIMIDKKDFWKIYNEIISAKFILTSSLHVAITAQSYKIPWAIHLAEGEKLNMPLKWSDVCEYLGIYENFKTVDNYEEGLKWWNDTGSKGEIPNLLPLIKSFPFPIKNERVNNIIKNLENINYG
jgi:hypothetical protein